MRYARLVFDWAHRHWLGLTAAAVTAVFVFGIVPVLAVHSVTRHRRYGAQDLAAVPSRRVAIVFGAGVQPDGVPTPYLRWRIETAVNLYKIGKAQKLLMSGDNSDTHYNEPAAMKRYAMRLGVPERDIALDYAGLSTYDTCYRAAHIFGVREAILVTQAYHVPRAVATCMGLGVQSVGVSAQRGGRDFTISYLLREVLSVDKALVQLVLRPHPKILGQPESIL